MKNQSFHQRKIRIQETPKLDHDQLKSRTVIALNRLGQQKFSTEPGGYSLGNWMKGMNILLDEFEEKMGPGNISEEYVEKRSELNSLLARPIPTASIDGSISELKQNIADVEGRIAEGRARLVSRMAELKSEQDSCTAELVRERESAPGLATENSGSFLKRLFVGDRKSSAKDTGKIEELESRSEVLSKEILEQQKLLKLVNHRSPGSPFAEDWKALDSLQTRLEALESERLEKVQLVKEREEIASSIANAVSKIPA